MNYFEMSSKHFYSSASCWTLMNIRRRLYRASSSSSRRQIERRESSCSNRFEYVKGIINLFSLRHGRYSSAATNEWGNEVPPWGTSACSLDIQKSWQMIMYYLNCSLFFYAGLGVWAHIPLPPIRLPLKSINNELHRSFFWNLSQLSVIFTYHSVYSWGLILKNLW